ncbi:uncharacterized protein LOC118404081 [Branchiostoma floridae]|nr:uncharacterized protein LOC118404081 [Branchiostoma floridae]
MVGLDSSRAPITMETSLLTLSPLAPRARQGGGDSPGAKCDHPAHSPHVCLLISRKNGGSPHMGFGFRLRLSAPPRLLLSPFVRILDGAGLSTSGEGGNIFCPGEKGRFCLLAHWIRQDRTLRNLVPLVNVLGKPCVTLRRCCCCFKVKYNLGEKDADVKRGEWKYSLVFTSSGQGHSVLGQRQFLNSKIILARADKRGVVGVAVDEQHCIMSWGGGFRTGVKTLTQLLRR